MNTDHALANLRDATAVLRSLGARPFLAAGTLLGAVRDGGFIAHDEDVDLGVFAEDLPPTDAIVAAFEARGFALYRQHGTRTLGYEIRFERHGIRVDVFAFYEDARGRFNAAWKKGRPIRRTYEPFGLAPLEFMGQTFLAPDPPERMLVERYGPDWSIPTTEWDWAWGPKNAEAWT